MKLSVDQKSLINKQVVLLINHGNETITWNVSGYGKENFSIEKIDIYKHINEFWALQSEVNQTKMFECYKIIKATLDDEYDTIKLISKLIPLVKQLFDLNTLDDIQKYVSWNSDIIIPSRFLTDYVVDDMKAGNRAKTYTRADYIGLVSICLQLRLMIPIWGEFIYLSKGDTGTNLKEYHAFHLMCTAQVMDSEAMQKLRIYVESNIPSDKSISAAILSGVGSEDYGTYLLALVIVRRLCIGDVSGSDPLINLVTYIYNFISQKVTGNNNTSFGDVIKDKNFEANNNSSDNSASRTEGYKVKQDIPLGDIVIVEHFLSNPYSVANKLDPYIPKELLDSCLQSCLTLSDKVLNKAQITLTQWVLAKITPPRGIMYLSKQNTINCIAITQAWLWYYGHKQLACLISAIGSDNLNQSQLSGMDSRARITSEQMRLLLLIYPFTVVKSSKQKTKPTNDAVAAIDSLVELFSQHDWILTANKEMTSQILGGTLTNRYSCPHDIKILLANLVLDLNKDLIANFQNNNISII